MDDVAVRTFQQKMVDALHPKRPVAGKVILELASYADLRAARRFLTWASRVIASNLYPDWTRAIWSADDGLTAELCDRRLCRWRFMWKKLEDRSRLYDRLAQAGLPR